MLGMLTDRTRRRVAERGGTKARGSWLGGLRRKPRPPALPAPERGAEPVAPPEPTVDRLSLAQWIWGQGCLLPGGTDYVPTLLAPVRLRPSLRVLDLTAGLGGPSRALAKAHGLYVTALERSAGAARRGRAQSAELGLGRQVPVLEYDPESFELKPDSFDVAFAQYLLAAILDKERLLREVRRGLRTGGQLGFVDFVLRAGEGGSPRLAPVIGPAPPGTRLWRSEQIVDCLAAAGFETRVAEDQSGLLSQQVLGAWERMAERVDLKLVPRLERAVLQAEIEPWLQRLQLIEAGVVGVVRFRAVAV